MNAAVWFGAAVLFTFGVEPAATSSQMRGLIGTNNFPYYSEAIGNIFATPFFHLHLACSIIAMAHLMAEWLYLGKYPPRRWLGLVLLLVLVGLGRGYGLQPALKRLHDSAHNRGAPVEQRQAAARAFSSWHAAAKTADIMLTLGLGIYLWRVGNPQDPTRFVSAKFRS